MAGLTSEGFIPATLEEIQTRIKSQLETYNTGFDFSIESPDGQLVEIFSFEAAQLWEQLGLVYSSFDPRVADGQGLRNIGLLSGLPFGAATRSFATIGLVGTVGTLVPSGSQVSDADGNIFLTEFAATIPSNVGVVANVPGPIPITAGTLTTIVTPITGWASFTQAVDGTIGGAPQSVTSYRNTRNRAVMSPADSVSDALKGKLLRIGLEQVDIQNNDTISALPDGTPAGHIHITVAEATISDLDIATEILKYKSLGTPTFGTTTVAVDDSQGNSHDIKFTKAAAVAIYVTAEVTFLSDDFAGAVEAIEADLIEKINALIAGENVVWSRLFSSITPYGKAQVNTLEIGTAPAPTGMINIPITATQYANTEIANIIINVV